MSADRNTQVFAGIANVVLWTPKPLRPPTAPGEIAFVIAAAVKNLKPARHSPASTVMAAKMAAAVRGGVTC